MLAEGEVAKGVIERVARLSFYLTARKSPPEMGWDC